MRLKSWFLEYIVPSFYLIIYLNIFRKVNEKMKEKRMDQRCKADRVVVDGNWDYMWPHQIEKTLAITSNKKLTSVDTSTEEASEIVLEFLCFSLHEKVKFCFMIVSCESVVH